MFGLFKQKPKGPTPPLPELLAKIPPEKRDVLIKQYEEFAEGEINEIEGAITYIQTGRIEYIRNLGIFLERSTVAIMLKDLQDFHDRLILQSSKGYPVLAVFTQNKRANKAREKHPENRYLAHIPFKKLVAGLDEQFGLVINPYEEVLTFQFNPEQLKVLKHCMSKPV